MKNQLEILKNTIDEIKLINQSLMNEYHKNKTEIEKLSFYLQLIETYSHA